MGPVWAYFGQKYWTRIAQNLIVYIFHRLAQAENKCKQMDSKRSLLRIFDFGTSEVYEVFFVFLKMGASYFYKVTK